MTDDDEKYLVVYGASYCSATREIWPHLENLNFVYFPYSYQTTKDQYWRHARNMLKDQTVGRFPLLIEVNAKEAKKIDDSSSWKKKVYKDPSSLIPGRIITQKDQLKEAFQGSEPFGFFLKK